ncbi:Armadillo-like helical [Cynara cardunculus var. scolymus]|uniref:Armadillo-like helical n=1 Tax=Cynara cardunculus var. scolymus TaxID=59895 RepID=A0A118JVT4_CYNCS|nr:Armadillo-like helical [Cynara cardunculus var. scolymus]
MEVEVEAEGGLFCFNPKDDTQQVLKILEALKQASHDLQKNPDSKKTDGKISFSHSPAIKALLELENESESILSNDPHLTTLSTHLSALKTLIHNSYNARQRDHGLRSFLIRRANSYEISRVAGSIESEIQAWIDREFIETLTQTLRRAGETKEEVLIDLMEQFEERIARGFDRELQDAILRSKVFVELETILCDFKFSKKVRETSAFAIAELIKFNKDVFVGQVLMGKTVRALISLSSVRSIQVLCILIRSIKSPIVDEIESNGEIPKIITFLSSDDFSIRTMAMDCVLEIGYFGRKEAIDAMLEEDLVKKLVELQKSETRGVLMDVRGESKNVERHPFSSCVARFAVQLEVGEGLRQREKRALKQVVLKRVKEAHVCDAEAATIIAEVLWGASP